jgi:hypothetical protein
LQSGVLRFSRRQELLDLAGRMGIGRFEANLIIATVQHSQAIGVAPAVRGSDAGRWFGYVLGATIAQSLILLGAFWMLWR